MHSLSQGVMHIGYTLYTPLLTPLLTPLVYAPFSSYGFSTCKWDGALMISGGDVSGVKYSITGIAL